jgi:glycosyltransferase involved in cell wall biosynthesis
LAWELSHALVRQGVMVDVLTTTCRSFHDDWGAHYHQPGSRSLDGLTVRRFKVDSRDRAAFTRANAKIMALPRISLRPDLSPLPADETRAFVADNINSAALALYLHDHGAEYDALLFVPYLYGTTLSGVPLVAEKAFIVPCLHDEAYAYLGPVRDAIRQARGLLFNSAGEAEVAGAIFGPAVYAKASLIGHAVKAVEAPRFPITIGSLSPHRSRYVLYLGRQDRSKNVDFLVDAFRAFRARRVSTSLQLVLAGPRPAKVANGDGIVSLGAVAEDIKASLLTYARALVQPSLHESFSRAMYESWHAGRPVVAHADCRATARAVEESGGGWIGTSVDDWVRILSEIDESGDGVLDAMGQRGRAVALDNGGWDDVAFRTLRAVDETYGRTAHGITIDQLVPLGARPVAEYAIALGDALQGVGADASVAVSESYVPRKGAQVIVHAVSPFSSRLTGAALIAHDAGLELPDDATPIFASSMLVLQGLAERGCSARLLPPVVNPAAWAGVRFRGGVRRFDDGRATILSVAPMHQADVKWLIDMFVSLIGLMGSVHLTVSRVDYDARALATLVNECRELDLVEFVTIIGDDIEERYRALRAARVAVGFGQPLPNVRAAVDPLWFDVPVIAFDDAVVREVIEPCGLIVADRRPLEVAALVKVAARDQQLRHACISEGRRVRARYGPKTVVSTLLEALVRPESLPTLNRTVRL